MGWLGFRKRHRFQNRDQDEHLRYPPARRENSVIDDNHGVKIPDPYRWLEDPDAEEVKEFVEKQIQLTDSILEKLETREKLRESIGKLFDHLHYGTPFREGNKCFFFHSTGLQPQDILYMQEGLEGEPEVLLDPNALSEKVKIRV